MRRRAGSTKRQIRVTGKHGGTMIELVLAIFVFVVAGTGIIGTFLSANLLSEYSRETSVALDDLKDMMERIEATPYTSLGDDFPDAVANGGMTNDYEAIVGGYSLDGQEITVTYPIQGAGITEIVATLTWMQRTRPRSLSLSTIRTSQ